MGREAERAAPGRRVLVIVNPVAGQRSGGRFEATLRRLEELGVSVTLARTQARGEAEALARQGAGAGYDVVVAAGGDGTINEVINGLAGREQVLAILPLGTANVLAAEIGLACTPEAVARVIATGQAAPVYLAQANGRYFALMAGVGLDAHVVAHVNLKLKKHCGKLAYVAQAARELLRYRPVLYTITLDGGRRQQAASVIVTKGRFYGGRFVCAPESCLGEPVMQVCLFKRPGWFNLVRYALGLVRGRLARYPDYEVLTAGEVLIAGPADEPFQLDGDPGLSLPLRVEIDRRPFRLLTPAGCATD